MQQKTYRGTKKEKRSPGTDMRKVTEKQHKEQEVFLPL